MRFLFWGCVIFAFGFSLFCFRSGLIRSSIESSEMQEYCILRYFSYKRPWRHYIWRSFVLSSGEYLLRVDFWLCTSYFGNEIFEWFRFVVSALSAFSGTCWYLLSEIVPLVYNCYFFQMFGYFLFSCILFVCRRFFWSRVYSMRADSSCFIYCLSLFI